MTGWPWNQPDEDDEEMEAAREEMEDFVAEAQRNPFAALDDDDVQDNPAYHEYEEEIKDAQFTAYAMISDLDEWEAEEADQDDGDGGGLWDE